MAMIDTLQAITHTVAQTRNPNVWMDSDLTFKIMPKPTLEAGYQIQVPVKIAAHVAETYQGLTPAVLDTVDFQRAFLYDWKFARVPMVYDGQSVIKNSGNKQSIVKLVTSVLENSEDSLTDKMVSMFFGTANDTSNDFNSFQHIANDAANTLGTGTTLGGLSKVTYPRLAGKGHALGSGVANGFVYPAAAAGLAKVADGSRQPDIYVGHPVTVIQGFGNSQEGKKSFVNTNTLMAGFTVYELFGKPFYAQRQVPYHASTYANNRVFGIDLKAIKFYIHKDRNFITEPFVKLQGQDGWASYRLVCGQLTSDDPARQIVYTGFNPAASSLS